MSIAIALSGILIGGLFAFTFRHLYREKATLIIEQNKVFRMLAEEYKGSYHNALSDVQHANVAHRETLDKFKGLLETMGDYRTEEWEMLYTLCEVLERNGTEFEPDSVLSTWWLQNKGTLHDKDQRR